MRPVSTHTDRGSEMRGKRTARIVTRTMLAVMLTLVLAVGAMAQGDDLDVKVTRVESEAFPQVTAYVTVLDGSGLPVVGLTEADIQIFEGVALVPGASVTVESDTSEALCLVLALDLSTPEESMARVREAMTSFIETQVELQDRVALLAFDREIHVAQDFTNDKRALIAPLEGLAAEHDYTSLNEVIFEGTTMVSGFSTCRKAMVVVVDIDDNTETRSANEAVSRAREVGVPVHVIAFGPKIKRVEQEEALHEVARLTGGRSFVLSQVDKVPDRLHTVGILLRQGYKVTFQSGLRADDAEHELSIEVRHQEGVGRGEGRFESVSSPVTVISLTDSEPVLSDAGERTVGGMVTLAAEATGAAPIAYVEYLLDGELLAKVDEPPYDYDWDSTTVNPGEHTLTIRVVDSAGNVGLQEIKLNVVLPVVVEIPALQEVVALGEEVRLEATVEVVGEVSSVEFLLDGEPVVQAVEPSYRFKWDSGTAEPGEHTLSVKVVDGDGHEGRAEASFRVIVPLEVTAFTLQDRIVLGEEVAIEAEVRALERLSRVEVLVDGRPLGSAPGPPYRFVFDSREYSAGEHQVTVRAVDVLGRESEASFEVQFQPPPPPPPTPEPKPEWPRYVAQAALVAAIVMTLVIFVILVRIQRRKVVKRWLLEIGNTGNVETAMDCRPKRQRER